MRRRPFRQAISVVEIRQRDQQARQRRLWRDRILALGVVLVAAASVTFAVIALVGGRDAASAGLGNGSSPGPIAAVPGATPRLGEPGAGSPAPGGPAAPSGGDGIGARPQPTPIAEPTSLEPEQLTGYQWPLSGGRVSGFFAQRDSGFLMVDKMRIHEGLDTTTFCGDRVGAAHDGTVLAAGRRFARHMGFDAPLDDYYARVDRRHTLFQLPIVVVIDDGNGYRSAYVHLGVASVKPGDVVKAGDLIGYEGMSGHASGCHLHYELFRMDGPWMRIAGEFVRRDLYPTHERERIDPFRVLSLKQPDAPRLIPGIDPPQISPGLGRPTVHLKRP
jgi:murein DD-endopeptidase MepM/ murein hydrolase activator NlpD